MKTNALMDEIISLPVEERARMAEALWEHELARTGRSALATRAGVLDESTE